MAEVITSKNTPFLYRVGMVMKPLCTDCNMYSTTPYETEEHESSNTVWIRFKCDYCNKTYGVKTEKSLMPVLLDYVKQVPL